MPLVSRPKVCALGVDSGTANTGIGIVTGDDYVLHADVLHPPHGIGIVERIHWFYDHLAALVRQYMPAVIGIEVYTAPSIKVRAITAESVARHHWLIGACMMLDILAVGPHPEIVLLEATDWMHQLTGIPANRTIGGKEIIEATVECRTGYIFEKNSGFHRSDAVGLALVALDNWQMTRYAQEAKRCTIG